jgi:putative PIN family toxin of toxin-antitoxin system
MVLLQAAVQPTRVHRSLHAIHTCEVQLCLSPELLAEVRDVLSRPKTRARFSSLTEKVVALFVADLESRAVLYQNVPKAFTWSMHPDDDHLFNLAIHAKARYLVTWETRILKLLTEGTAAADLLRQLAPGLSIITPAMLAEALKLIAPQ